MNTEDLIGKRFSELADMANSEILLPGDKVKDELVHKWSTGVLNLLQRAFGENSVHYINFQEKYKLFSGYDYQFINCRGIFLSAKEDYEGGYLFNYRSLIKAELISDDVLDQAKELLESGYKDPACVLAGVALEITLKELCTQNGIDHNSLDRMNSDLCKSNQYNMAKQKQITDWADLRNKAAHGDWSSYNSDDIKDFINGVNRFIADYL